MRLSFAALLATCAIAACANNPSASTRLAGAAAGTVDQATASLAGDPGTIQWGPAPAVLPAGAEIAVLQGDPGKAEPFTVRLRFPSGYRIAPHTHPTAENVTVIKGTFLAGMGTSFVERDLRTYGRDGFVSLPAAHPHYAMARGQTIVQVHAIGPFAIEYVNPADNPAPR